MDDFMCLALTFFWFVHTLGKFFRGNLKEQFEVIGHAKSSLYFQLFFPRAHFSSSESSGDEKYRKRAKNNRTDRLELDYAPIESI